MAERHSIKRSSLNGEMNGFHHIGNGNGKLKRNGQVSQKLFHYKGPAFVKGNLVYRAVICIVIACFLVEAMLQRSLMLYLKGTDGDNTGEFRVSSVDEVQKKHGEPLSKIIYASAKYVPERLFQKLRAKTKEYDKIGNAKRIPVRSPRLALVCHDLSKSPHTLLLHTVAQALQELGYDLQLYSIEDGPLREEWEALGINVDIMGISLQVPIDWLNFEGVLVSSLEVKSIMSSLIHEPFNSVPLVWMINEKSLGMQIGSNGSAKHGGSTDEWKLAFHRANIVVFSDYTMPMLYSAFDSGNFLVIPGSPKYAWEAQNFLAKHKNEDLRKISNFTSNDFVLAIVGSQFYSSELWQEDALVMQALTPLLSEFKARDRTLRVIIIHESLNSSYELALQAIAEHLGYSNGSVKLVYEENEVTSILSFADLIIYGSLREEQSFPAILVKAMSFGKPVLVPSTPVIKRHMQDRVHGFFFPVGRSEGITESISMAVSNCRLTELARKVSVIGKEHAVNLLVSDAIESYVTIVEKVCHFPSEVSMPSNVSKIPRKIKESWQLQLLRDPSSYGLDTRLNNSTVISEAEAGLDEEESLSMEDDSFSYAIWEEEKTAAFLEEIERRKEEELDERRERVKRTWEEVYRGVKKVERTKGELHERDDGELERTGQPLSIYEPYQGSGAWPFLNTHSLYRGIGLSTRGRRPGSDDIDGPARLPLLNNAYYRDSLCEFGAFFALANRVDRIHKNSWIGFQSWRAVGRNASLSNVAEKRMVEIIQSGRHGSALYFWARMDKDGRVGKTTVPAFQQDFWFYCDALNAGNCRATFTDTFRRMYNLPKSWRAVPPMPSDGGTWSVLHSWAMPTRSYMEFMMFARMFVDALDAQNYHEHHDNGKCCLSISKDPHCYCRILELLVNVWAYHSARRMIYVNPETGQMREYHNLKSRKGHMWVKWFNFNQLKNMDEDLAEEFDSDKPVVRWLWPLTGEVYWRGIYERERNARNRLKIERKKKSRDKLSRMRNRYRQKSLGKYIKPPIEDSRNSSSLEPPPIDDSSDSSSSEQTIQANVTKL